jgi:hypothetical protein
MFFESLPDKVDAAFVVVVHLDPESYRVVHLSETFGRYIQPSAGPLANDITELAREELRFDLRALLHWAFSRNETSLSGPIAVCFDGAARRAYLQVRPQSGEASGNRSAVERRRAEDALRDSEARLPSRLFRASPDLANISPPRNAAALQLPASVC